MTSPATSAVFDLSRGDQLGPMRVLREAHGDFAGTLSLDLAAMVSRWAYRAAPNATHTSPHADRLGLNLSVRRPRAGGAG